MGTSIKTLLTLVMTMFAMFSTVEAKASTDWTVNPSAFRYDMSMYFNIAYASGETILPDEYQAAAFVGEECRGVSEMLDLPDGGKCFYMRVRSNQASGEDFAVKFRNIATGEVVNADIDKIPFVADERLGYPSAPYALTAYRTFRVELSTEGHGTLDVESCDVREGSPLTVTATPAEGYSFSKWSDDNTDNPRVITVNDNMTLEAIFTVNQYTLTFKIGEDVLSETSVDYGSAITAPEAPAKEGYTFAGWEEFPETMPASDLTVTGKYTVNQYKLTFKIGDEVLSETTVDYGSAITAPEAPAKEGYTFAGWEEFPETMPASDLTVNGKYTVNQYKLTFKIGEDVLSETTVDYGSAITAPEAPAKEGYTFEGWEEFPETMPASDLTVTGKYTVNQYKLTFKIGDEVLSETTVDYGSAITAPEAPAKEGYTFEGWEDFPETMPAHDLTVNGKYTVNQYKLTVYLDDNIVSEEMVDYGTVLDIPIPEAPKGYKFDRWLEKIPETMPAYDLEIHGVTRVDELSSVATMYGDGAEEVDVYSVTGQLLLRQVRLSEIDLVPGIYIIAGRKILVR